MDLLEGMDFPTSVSLQLKCVACGHVARYTTDTIYIDSDLLDTSKAPEEYVSFSSYFRCRKCKSAWPWEFGPDAYLAVTAMMLAKQVRPEDTRLEFASPRLYDGTPFRSAAQAEEHLLGVLETNPDDAHVWSRLGNVYRRSSLFPKAKKAYKQALKIDPDHFESHFNLGAILYDAGDYAKSAEHLNAMLVLASRPQELADENLRGIVGETLGMLADIASKTGLQMPPFPARKSDGETKADHARVIRLERFNLGRKSDRERAVDLFVGEAKPASKDSDRSSLPWQKVGRNEPCPCGSGIKYKKCCGR